MILHDSDARAHRLAAVPIGAVAVLLALASCAQHDTAPPVTPQQTGEKRSEESMSVSREIQDAFPGYRPKLSPDTARDYRMALAPQIEALPAASLQNLPRLVSQLAEHQKQAAESPGTWVQGNIALGGDEREYRPSDHELLAGELGGRIAAVVASASVRDIGTTLEEAGITATQVTYHAFEFRHIDAMGSGRFFYASGPIVKAVDLRK